MDPLEFLRLAAILAQGKTEVEWRSAIGRAYYAAFHIARQLLLQLGFAVPRADRAHAYLWLRLSHAGDTGIEQAGSDLNGLRGDRNWADYDLKRRRAQAFSQGCVQVANDIIGQLKRAHQEPLRTQIADAMKIYERDVLKDVTWHP
jgi:uncharacterized protein (UPF0332 family)